MFNKKYRLICITDNLQTHDTIFHKSYAIEYKSWYSFYWFTYRDFGGGKLEYVKRYFNLLITNKLKETEVIC
jgi:hypothetical protein